MRLANRAHKTSDQSKHQLRRTAIRSVTVGSQQNTEFDLGSPEMIPQPPVDVRSGVSPDDYAGARSRLVVACPICDSRARRLFMKNGYWILGCETCSHRFTEIHLSPDHVERVYDSEYFRGGGSGYPDYLGEARILRRHGQRYGRLLARYMQAGRVLDAGAAAGFILQGLMDCGWSGAGIEPNLEMVEFARRRGLQVHNVSLEEFQSSDRFDLVSMIQVVAHFSDVRKALQVAADVTSPSGFWLIETWNIGSFTARLFGKQWHEYSPPSTLNYFSVESLKNLAAQFGFREVAHGTPLKRINGAHAKSLLRYKLEGSLPGRILLGASRFIPDRLSVPYPSEDLSWMLFRKS